MGSGEAIDTLWLLLAAVLVLLMQGGFLCLESGLTRSKNAINVALKNAFDLLVVTILYWSLGYALMFGEYSGGWPALTRLAADFSQSDSREAAFFLFQLTFCATAATIVSGAIAERSRFITYVMITILIAGVIYPVVGHWSWSGAANENGGWLEVRGFTDFAGSTVVHGVGGWVALAAVIVIGPRQGRFEKGEVKEIPGSNLPLTMLAMLFFVIGWLGFNGGSTLAFNAQVPGILVNTILAGAGGGIAALLISHLWLAGTKVTSLTINGTLAGLVAVTAGVHVITTPSAVLIGAVGGVVMVMADQLMLRFRLDDAVSAVPVHLAAGIWGTLAVAFMGDPNRLGTGLSFPEQLLVQLQGIIVIGLFSFSLAFGFLLLLQRFLFLRVSASGEAEGLNVAEHGARTELSDVLRAMAQQEKTGDLAQRLPVEPFTEVGQIASQYNRVMTKLNQVADRNRLILKDIRDGVLTFDDSGVIASANPGAESLFGTSADAMIGQSSAMVLHQDSHALFPTIEPGQILPRLASAHTEQPHELVASRKDGTPFPIEVTTAASPTRGGVQYSAVIRDISERRRMEEQLHRHSEMAQVTLEAITEAVVTCDGAMDTVYLNPFAIRLTGWSSREGFGQRIDCILCLRTEAGEDLDPLSLCDTSRSAQRQSLQLVHREGKVADVELTVAPLLDHSRQPMGWAFVMQDVTSSKQLKAQLSYQAIHDPLTGLVNRREFERRVEALLQDAAQNGTHHVLCYLDLDQFKFVNDSCGHQAGDALLQKLAETIKSRLRQSDTLARLGGDEFGVLFGHCPMQRGLEIAEQLREAVSDFRFVWEQQVFRVGVSIGLVPLSGPELVLDTVLGQADKACYEAKNLGRNQVYVYSQEDSGAIQISSEQVPWVDRIKQALDGDLFRLFFQPVVPVDRSRRVMPHYEMLLYLKGDEGQMTPSGAFMPAAERASLVADIDLWVIRNTLAWMGDRLRGNNDPLMCAVKLSGASVGQQRCLDAIRDQLEKQRVPAECVCFEIDEAAVTTDLAGTGAFIAELRQMGCCVALDHFGSGLSSFGYLKKLSVDYLRLDAVFVRDLASEPVDRAVVKSISNVARLMGVKTIATSVEEKETMAALRELEIDYAQGGYLKYPQPLEQLGDARVMPR